MVDVYGAASDVGLNCATGINIGGGGGTPHAEQILLTRQRRF